MSQDTEYQATFLELIEPLWDTDGLTRGWTHEVGNALRAMPTAGDAMACLWRYADTPTQRRIPLFVAGMLCAKSIGSVTSPLMKARLALAYAWGSYADEHLRGMVLDEHAGLPPGLADTGLKDPKAENSLGRTVFWHMQQVAEHVQDGNRQNIARALRDLADAYCVRTAEQELARLKLETPQPFSRPFGHRLPDRATLREREDLALRKTISLELVGSLDLHMILQAKAPQAA